MLAALCWGLWCLCQAWRCLWVRPAGCPHLGRRIEPAVLRCRAHRKPEWVIRQLVLLQAHLPHAGCRTLALTFNRVFAHRHVSVSKSFVHQALRDQAHAVFTTGFRLLGIRHQRIDLHCPWQNGRVERFFGTLKQYLRQWEFDGKAALDLSLSAFVAWYNGVRPHQNLGGMTPREAWDGIDPFHAPQAPKEVEFVQGWDGLIAGFRIRRR